MAGRRCYTIRPVKKFAAASANCSGGTALFMCQFSSNCNSRQTGKLMQCAENLSIHKWLHGAPMSDRSPWFKFNASAWMTHTMMMGAQERGVYITMIAVIAVNGFMPDDARVCARACGVSVRSWKKIRSDLVDGGYLAVANGRLVSPLLDSWSPKPPKAPLHPSLREWLQ